MRGAQSCVRALQNVRFPFRGRPDRRIKCRVQIAHWSKGIRRIGVGLWVGSTVELVVLFWLLLFVAPAQFNAHTSTGLVVAALLVLVIPVLIASIVSRLWRATRT